MAPLLERYQAAKFRNIKILQSIGTQRSGSALLEAAQLYDGRIEPVAKPWRLLNVSDGNSPNKLS